MKLLGGVKIPQSRILAMTSSFITQQTLHNSYIYMYNLR